MRCCLLVLVLLLLAPIGVQADTVPVVADTHTRSLSTVVYGRASPSR